MWNSLNWLAPSRGDVLDRIHDVTQVLALSLRFGPTRRLLARMRWPRREHLARLSADQFHGYVRAIGLEAEAQAALSEYRRQADDQYP